MYTPENLA